MAEHGIFGHTPGQSRVERIDVIDTLAGKRPFGEQVLIHIRHRGGIGFDPAGTGHDPLIPRTIEPHRQGRGDAGLQNAVAFGHPAHGGIKPGAVQRMRQFADQTADGIAGQPGVRVQGDHIADIGGHGDARQECGVGRPAQQAVQFGQLAALTLPSHPAGPGRIPQPAAVQQQEPGGAGHRIGLVQPVNGGGRCGDQSGILRGHFGRGIRAVRQQGIMHRPTDAGQIVHLEPFDLGQQIGRAVQQNRHRHQRA